MKISASSLRARTSLQVGNAASDKCYFHRNLFSLQCGILGWPQSETDFEGRPNICRGNRNEINMMACLDHSGNENWWQSFPGCTSAIQCLDQAFEKHKNITGSDKL